MKNRRQIYNKSLGPCKSHRTKRRSRISTDPFFAYRESKSYRNKTERILPLHPLRYRSSSISPLGRSDQSWCACPLASTLCTVQ